MAVLAYRGTAAQHGAHVDHGALADHRADVDDGTHHDDGVIANLNAIADDGAGLDARVRALEVEQGHAGVATVVLDHAVLDVARGLGGNEHGTEVFPLAKDHAALGCAKDVSLAVVHLDSLALANVDLHGRLLWGRGNEVDDFLSVHRIPFNTELSHRCRLL